ncbi:hypothetical protein FGG78_19995 [Thioclava sp. BHET1]|nr:hypothetical protein FGG78_19995 [Thioclava sp. BHET1]
MDAEARREGRERVRVLLVERLTDAGLRPVRRQRPSAYEEMWKRLVDHFAYMDAENLMTLAEQLMDNAEGKRRDECPAEVVIRNLGHALQSRPMEELRIVSSWLASVEGPIAEAGGYLVELYRWLKEKGRPPLQWDMRQIREAAQENNRTLILIRGRQERGEATERDRQWSVQYEADRRDAHRIVDAGKAKRDAA